VDAIIPRPPPRLVFRETTERAHGLVGESRAVVGVAGPKHHGRAVRGIAKLLLALPQRALCRPQCIVGGLERRPRAQEITVGRLQRQRGAAMHCQPPRQQRPEQKDHGALREKRGQQPRRLDPAADHGGREQQSP
jgi:hypothetical protein